jgi:hypothetical protein
MDGHVAAATVRGTSHRRSHAPCQDAAVVGVRVSETHVADSDGDCGPLVVGALADGGGTRVLSHIGARLVTSFAKSSMLACWTAARFLAASEDELDTFWKDLIEDCRTLITEEAVRRSHGARQPLDPGAFACTLTTFMATRDRLAAAQIGDGFVVLGRSAESTPSADGEARFELLLQGRETEEASQVVWITATDCLADYQHAVVQDGPFDMVIASSDGIENIVLAPTGPVANELHPHQPFFDKLRGQLRHQAKFSENVSCEALNHRIAEILSDPELDNWVDDDKSVVVALWV